MLKRLLAAWIIMALAFVLAAWVAPGMSIHGGPVSWLWLAAAFAALNLVLGTMLRLVTAPPGSEQPGQLRLTGARQGL